MAQGIGEIGPKDQQDQDQITSQVLSSLQLPKKETTETIYQAKVIHFACASS